MRLANEVVHEPVEVVLRAASEGVDIEEHCEVPD
jgi:hypothetical protein